MLKPLSDEVVYSIFPHSAYAFSEELHDFARAVESAHGITMPDKAKTM